MKIDIQKKEYKKESQEWWELFGFYIANNYVTIFEDAAAWATKQNTKEE